MTVSTSTTTTGAPDPAAPRPALADVRRRLAALGWAARAGAADHGVMFKWQTWLFSWFVRMLAQVLFFTVIGSQIGPGQARFLLIGNAVLMVTLHGLHTTASTTWEIENGTLPLLVASPSSPALVLAGRSLFWLPDGLACGLGAILLLSPVGGLHLTPGRVVLVTGLLVVIALASYCLGLFLGSLVLTAADLRNVVSNATLTAMMALCGVEFPRADLGAGLDRVGAVLPLTHGLQAVRDVLGGAAGAHTAVLAGQEAAVGCLWLAAASAVLALRARRSRRDGAALFLG